MSDRPDHNSDKAEPPKPGPGEARLAEMLRVDHAGEYGAVAIYRGQQAVFNALPHKAETAAAIAEMEAGEEEHLKTFDRLLAEKNIRPTLLAPLWNVAGFGLGAATALMGEKAAMACTAAVEDVIEKHYGEQAKALGEDEPELAATITQFREDELGHKHTAEEAGAEAAPGYTLLAGVIRAGCRAAIKIAEKV
ncbi:MAG: 2-nonaprenyl-3-methyl-6-methoxy-1,4-benzoquinol hydroxylase [Hyphococcus sp.]|nr:MAG: 2-nonaprenyl-3-methyl-6-methoxy-1,4-benzoquinol hydroxylase [Marinicaulis sp.]